MNGTELRDAIAVLFDGNQTKAARVLGISSRAVRAALTDPANSSYRALNPDVVADIEWMLTQFPGGVREVDPRQTIEILRDLMMKNGLSDGDAAAAILGAAHANAVRAIGAGATEKLLSRD